MSERTVYYIVIKKRRTYFVLHLCHGLVILVNAAHELYSAFKIELFDNTFQLKCISLLCIDRDRVAFSNFFDLSCVFTAFN